MAEPASGGKWAAEAFDFLRLHQRVRNQFYGLLLWQVAWVGLLWLSSKLHSGPPPYALELPFFELRCVIPWTSAAPGTCIEFKGVPLTRIYPIGAVIVLLMWLRVSRLSILFTRPLLRLVRGIVFWTIFAITLLLAILALPVSGVSAVVRRVQGARVKRRKARAAAAENKASEPGGKAAATGGTGNRKPSLRERIAKGDFETHWLQELMFSRVSPLVRALVPPISMGIARIESFTAEEELIAARIPTQLFLNALNRLRDFAVGSAVVVGARVDVLPEALQIASPQRARWLRRWLGYDAVLWGSLTRDAEPMLRLNVEIGSVRAPERKAFGDSWGPLAHTSEPRSSSILVQPDDPIDAMVALLLAMRHAIDERAARFHLTFPGGLDPVYVDRKELGARIAGVLLDLLHRREEPVDWPAYAPLATHVLVAEAMAWVKERVLDMESTTTKDINDVSLSVLAEIVEKSLELVPGNPDLHYLAAVTKFAATPSDEAGALRAIEQGWELDRVGRFASWAAMTSVAGRSLLHAEDARMSSERKHVHAAKAAVYADLGIRLDERRARRSIRRKIESSRAFTRVGLDVAKFDELLAGERRLWGLVGLPEPPEPPAPPPPAAPEKARRRRRVDAPKDDS